ncbi:LamB/YcsF family protein [Bifidobacterium moukalabense]|uniref:LamB/YcsF family protein n=1 Tax=Bifidobacterium moukalabense TaxID=1333651 RepID=UPI0010F7EC85|nr:5-oxoprolinase subunit PxpA [Bifidobacterium moukalabense]
MNGIDLNSDMGESFGRWKLGDDEALLAVVSSANVACGFHAGDPSVMLRTLEVAGSRGVAVGAHVAYHDLAGFGRRYIDVTPAELKADVMYQIAALEGLAHAVGTGVRYVKPHGALYNRIVHDEAQASAVVDAIRCVDPSLGVLTQPGAVVGRLAADAGLRVFHEAFADRAYNPDGTLVSRRLPGAVIADPVAVAARVLRMATRHEVEAIDGSVVTLDADSVCVHGDSPSAVAMARAVRAHLEAEGIEVHAFAADRETKRHDSDRASGYGASNPEASDAMHGGVLPPIGRRP